MLEIPLQEKIARNDVMGPIDCPVCGRKHLMIENWGNLRESGLCPHCKASNRARQLGLAAALYATQVLDVRISTVEGLHRHPDIRIYNTECQGALHKILRGAAHYVCSEYLGDDVKPGASVNGVRHEDLRKTSFADSTFDLILSTEVFEHIPEPYKAHEELFRILKPGGAHVFTVPYISNVYEDIVKASVHSNGSVIHHQDPEYHGDPIRNEGILVFTIFAQQMVDKLCNMGYLVRILHLRIPEFGILGGNNRVFIAVKP